jgi:4-amino-4-deoxy-L-arabinose transferase-like glycosyltransferase
VIGVLELVTGRGRKDWIRPFPDSVRTLPLAAVWLAFAVRVLYLWQIADAPFFGLRLGDAEAYHEWARRIAAGDWPGSGVFYQAPLYPYCLALIYSTVGESVAIVRLFQAMLGATSCALLGAAGIVLFGRAGLAAGLALAIYPLWRCWRRHDVQLVGRHRLLGALRTAPPGAIP